MLIYQYKVEKVVQLDKVEKFLNENGRKGFRLADVVEADGSMNVIVMERSVEVQSVIVRTEGSEDEREVALYDIK